MSHTRTVQSSELVTIHFPSQWNATPVMLFVCPSKVMIALGLLDLMSYNLTTCRPAAARYFLSGVIHSRFTCDSGCCIVREHIPESASQNL